MPSLTQIRALTLVADGDGYVVGSPHTAEYVEVPPLGARIIEWLQEGVDVAECERRAAEAAGEPVDVPGFLTTLADEGLFTASAGDDGADPGPRLRRWAGAALFHPLAWAVYALAALAAPVLLVAVPSLRPSYRDGFPFHTQLLNIVAVSALGVGAAALHEAAHVLAAARHGLRSRLAVTRRLYFVTFQADLTRLWSLPRRARYGPLLAGVAWDLVVLAAALLAQASLAGALGPMVVRLLRALVLLQVTAMVAQLLVFMRTDVYALLVNATGCKTLWATKGALLRRYLRRATPADEEHLAGTGAGEIAWARRYLWLYVPGIALALGYLATFAVPGTLYLIRLCLAPIRAGGLGTAAAWAGLAALAIAVVPSLLALLGAARSGLRVLRTATMRRQARRAAELPL
ncbi:hypothetical protein ABT369_24950 [Dactylosporangium sp. NPDC000244]|uniref:hypothetical protein n=1 Tax=Dactylosporangium sp. NPDC000244 TaxID=3154365 RepID=UPI00332843B0